MATPLMILIGIHYYTTGPQAGEYAQGTPHGESPAVHEQRQMMLDSGLLREAAVTAPRRYERTDALTVWIDALCDVPFPIQKWVIQE